MNTQTEQDKQSAKAPSHEAEGEHSPWTEPFLRSQDTGTFDRVTDADVEADQKRAARAHAGKMSPDRQSDDATHDALSTIFHGN